MGKERRRDFAILALSGFILTTAVVLKITGSDHQDQTDNRTDGVTTPADFVGLEETNLVSVGLAEDETFVQQRISEASDYIKSSRNDFLINNSQLETSQVNGQIPEFFEQLKVEEVIYVAHVPEEAFSQGTPEPVDFYFRLESDHRLTPFLVIDPQFVNSQKISSEELAIILVQKGLVLRGIYPSLAHQARLPNASAQDLESYLNSTPSVKLRGDLELNSWWALAHLALGPMKESGELESERLKTLIPDPVLTRGQLLVRGREGFQKWLSQLPASIFPGLPHQ